MQKSSEKMKKTPPTAERQITIYLVMGGAVLVIAFVLIFLLSQSLDTQPAYSNAPDAIATDTAVLQATYPELANWHRLTDREVAIWLPASYQHQTHEQASASFDNIAPEYQYLAQALLDHPDTIRMTAYDTNTINNNAINHLLIAREPERNFDIDSYIRASLSLSSLSRNFIQEATPITVGGYDARQLIYTNELSDIVATINYVVHANDHFYSLSFTVDVSQVNALLPITQTAMNTLRIY